MFRGSYNRVIESKGRISLPAEITRELGKNPVFVACFKKGKGHLQVYPEMPTGLPFTQIAEGRIDRGGRRLLIPADLRKLLKGKETLKEILVVGAGDHLEIWRPENFPLPEITEKELANLKEVWQ